MGIFSAISGFFTNQGDSFSGVVGSPSVNVDGAPMIGAVDANGNPFGVTQSDDCVRDNFLHDSFSADVETDSSLFESSFDDDFSTSFASDDAFSSDFSSCDSF